MAAMAGLKKIRWDEKKSGSGHRTYFMHTGLRIMGIGGWHSGGIGKKNYAGKQNVPPASQKTKIGRDENE